VHQGLLLEARPLPALDIADIEVKSGLTLALDQVTDPHNVGAILRTAAAFAVDAVIVTERNAPDFSGVLAKTASGGLEHVPLIEVVNLSRALTQLGEAGFLRVGLDSEGPASLENTVLSRPTVLVLGAEGKGLRRLTREKCDALARLDMPGAIKSLNVSNACAVALTLARISLKQEA
jgi:23S rRNA (guanosine2251-2'-O)-methyltransferase